MGAVVFGRLTRTMTQDQRARLLELAANQSADKRHTRTPKLHLIVVRRVFIRPNWVKPVRFFQHSILSLK